MDIKLITILIHILNLDIEILEGTIRMPLNQLKNTIIWQEKLYRTGDKNTENYLQHADHFSRILISQELSKATNTNNVVEQSFSKNDEGINSDTEEISKDKNIDV